MDSRDKSLIHTGLMHYLDRATMARNLTLGPELEALAEKISNMISLDDLNYAIEREYTDGATDSADPPKNLFDLHEEVEDSFSVDELLETGSVTIKLGKQSFVVSLQVIKE